jgi:ribosome-associated protein
MKSEDIIAVLEQHKAENITLIPLKGKTDLADAMIVASGTSNRHLSALAEYVKLAFKPQTLRIDGAETGTWVIVDLGSVIVHLFSAEARAHYRLESIWSSPAKK